MKLLCRLFKVGCTWVPEIQAPDVRWNTTKGMHTLASSFDDVEIKHFEVCRRCGERRELAPLTNDADRPTNDDLTIEKKDKSA